MDKEKDSILKDIVLSSRIRLARNIDKIPFPNKISDEESENIINKVKDIFSKNNHKFISLKDLDSNDINCLLEKNIISSKLASNKDKSAVILGDNKHSIMINEEDHIRIQSIEDGLNLEKAFEKANKIDDIIENNLEYAFDEKLGYLTACPTNIGTGLRASIMIHLPALSMNNRMPGIFNAVSQVGMTVRGRYGEGSRALGNIYQISNQITLGLEEKEIINNLKAAVNQVINEENLTRNKLMENSKYEIEDKIYRSLGILKSAVLLNNVECLNLLSSVRLGIEMSIIKDIKYETINKLILDTQPANLKNMYGKDITEKQVKYFRANMVKEEFNIVK